MLMEPIHVLHFYYTRASVIRECLKGPNRYRWWPFLKFPAQGNLNRFLERLPVKWKATFHVLLHTQDKMHLLLVFYSLLYVVIEGYQEQDVRDSKIDELLKSDNVALLKRFRNAVFHFQKDLESQKLLGFLEKPETELWTQQVFKAFGRFFLEQSEKFFEKTQA